PSRWYELRRAAVGGREPGAWEYVLRWIGSVALLALCVYLVLLGVTRLADLWQPLQTLTRWSWWRYVIGAVPVLVAGATLAYQWWFGRSDTRVKFVESDPI